MLIIIFQETGNGNYDSVDLATTFVKRSISKYLWPVEVYLEKSCIFKQSIFKKVPPGNPRNRIRDYSRVWLFMVKGFPKFNPKPRQNHSAPPHASAVAYASSSSLASSCPPEQLLRVALNLLTNFHATRVTQWTSSWGFRNLRNTQHYTIASKLKKRMNGLYRLSIKES